MKNLLRQLTQIVSPSGYEHQIREAVRELVTPYADDVRTDALGNLIVRKGAVGQGKRIMLAAHMDEIGVMVSHIDERALHALPPLAVCARPIVWAGGCVSSMAG